MAIAAVPLVADLVSRMSPDDAIEFIKAAEEAAAEARSLIPKIAHSASLTHKEEYIGWAPLLLILYRIWQSFIGPQVEFGLATQIGLSKVLNRFGAGIDTSRLEKILKAVDKSIMPFGQQKQKQSQGGTATGVTVTLPGGTSINTGWAVL